MIVGLINKYYKSLRKVEVGLDPRLSAPVITQFLAHKLAQKVRSTLRGRAQGFEGPGVKIFGAGHLTVGTNVVFGNDVTISAVSVDGISMGDNVTIDNHAILRASGVIRNLGVGIAIGPRTSIGAFNFIHGGGGVSIGSDCLLGPYVSIYSENHNYQEIGKPIRMQGETRAAVSIENDVWIGSGSTIPPGVTVGLGAVVAAGSVVTRSVAPFTVVGGVPAKVLKNRTGVHVDPV